MRRASIKTPGILIARICAVALVVALSGFAAIAEEPSPQSDSSKPLKYDPELLKQLIEKAHRENPGLKGTVSSETSGQDMSEEHPITVTLVDVLRQRIKKCFDAGELAAREDADRLYADVSFELSDDGSMLGAPMIVKTGPGKSYELAAIARKAVMECAPYGGLPRDEYPMWRHVTARFTVSGMM